MSRYILICVLTFVARSASAQDTGPEDAARQRYVDASVELACAALELPLSRQDGAREARSAEALRRHKYTRGSYAADVSRYAEDRAAHASIVMGSRRCARSGEVMVFRGEVRGGAAVGQGQLSLSAEQIQGYLRLTVEGVQLTLAVDRQPRAGDAVQLAGVAGGSGGWLYTFAGVASEAKLVGRLRLWRAGGAALEVPVELQRAR